MIPTDVELVPSRLLRAGNLTCQFESGNLRYITWENTEVVRKIYGAVRDEQWNTLPCNLHGEEVQAGELEFSISYMAFYRRGGIVYKARFRIEGKPDNSITFSMRGEALAPFMRNRIGLCVHHPIPECRGREAEITQPDGTRYRAVFPEAVSPWQPFRHVQQMQWSTASNLTVQLSFTGDLFETEDQRNWSDSSFKTYSTPLELPYPVKVVAGATIEQSVTLRVSGIPAEKSLHRKIEEREEKIAFPKIGFGRPDTMPPLTEEMIQLMKQIPFHHYRVTLIASQPGWPEKLAEALREAAQLQTLLELVLELGSDAEPALQKLALILASRQSGVYSILLLRSGEHLYPPAAFQPLYAYLKSKLPNIKTGYGTAFFFADLNRHRPGKTDCDFISFSLNPQVHATDNRTLMENLEQQEDLLQTAAGFAKGKPVYISPMTLQHSSVAEADPREYTGMAAWWTLLSLPQLCTAKLITLCDVWGAQGLMQSQNEAGLETLQRSRLYEALVQIKSFRPVWIVRKRAGHDLLPGELLLENEQGARLGFKAPVELQAYKLR